MLTPTRKQQLANIMRSPWLAFLLGVMVGLIFFAASYGLAVVNPTNVDWIWQSITHDTAQHQLGWEFYRADTNGATIYGLAYPSGLSMVFMDVIPLLALFFNLFGANLPVNFQYFGIWGLLCYMLMGGLSAILIRYIWQNVAGGARTKVWIQLLFVAAGSLIFVLSPMVMARSFYHPALAGQWLILLGFILIVYAGKFKNWLSLGAVWTIVLVVTILIHPYFLPMMGVLLVLSAIRYWTRLTGSTKLRWVKAVAMVLIPAALSLLVFALMGGFSLGSGAEHYDLEEKGFNLLSFVNPGGYSIIPAFPNKSSSPETMMWLGLGVIIMLIIAAILWRGGYRASWVKFRKFWNSHRGQCRLAMLFCALLLVFAMGTRIDLGPITLLQYSVPDKIYELWSAFRAAAREAWPFYYATILLGIYWLAKGLTKCHWAKFRTPIALAIGLVLVAGLQLVDIANSPNATAKRAGFVGITDKAPEFTALELGDMYTGQKHLVALNDGFRGDQHGTYIIGRTALKYGMTLNTGFFARVPDEVKNDQEAWRRKFADGKVADDDLKDNLFFATDENLVNELSVNYELIQIDNFYFVKSEK